MQKLSIARIKVRQSHSKQELIDRKLRKLHNSGLQGKSLTKKKFSYTKTYQEHKKKRENFAFCETLKLARQPPKLTMTSSFYRAQI